MISPDDFKTALLVASTDGALTVDAAWGAIEPLLLNEMPKVVQAAYDSGRSHAMAHLVANDGMGI